jgi:hypothetical protein
MTDREDEVKLGSAFEFFPTFTKSVNVGNPPEQWSWSSYRGYASGEQGAVRINQWGEANMKIQTPAA